MSEDIWQDWHFDYEQALEQARKMHKPVFLQFHRDPCSGCKKLYAVTYPDPDVAAEMHGWFVCLRQDIRQDRKVRGLYSAVWMPSFYVLDYRGKAYFSFPGFLEPEDFRVILRLGLAEYLIPRGQYTRAWTVLKEGLELFPDNPRAATLLFRMGMVEYLQTWDNKRFRAVMEEIRERYPHSPEARMWPWME